MEPQAAQRTIEEIIAADDVKFRTLKQRAEYVDYARGLSFNERDDTRRAEKLAQWEAGTAEHAEVFVSADYYATSIAPRIQALTDDPEAFARVSELSVLALEHIGVYLLTEGKDRKLPVASFFEQFFAGLHRESPETIAAFAKIEASRMQGLFPMMTTTAMDFNAWIAECRASPFAEHLPELIDIGGGEHHPNAIFAVPFWKQALPTLEQLTVRGHPELIPTYLTIARATLQRHGRFNVSKPDTADRIIALRECGAHLDAGVRLYEALADNILSESANDVARIVQEIRVLAAQRSGDEVAALLTEATTLANARVYPLPYLNAVRGDTAYAERGRMREVALAVASTAPSGARRYLECMPAVLALGEPLRQTYDREGIAIAAQFTGDAEQYFPAAAQVLGTAPERFPQWLAAVRAFGERNPLHVGTFAETSARVPELTDQLLSAALRFTEQVGVPSWKREGSVLHIGKDDRREETITREHDAEYLPWFGGIIDALRAGMTAEVFSEILRRLKERKLTGYHGHVFTAMREGIEPLQYVAVLPDLVRYDMLDLPLAKLHTVITGTLPLERKGELLRDYGLASDALDDLPELDVAGGWKAGLEDRLHAAVAEGLSIVTTGMQFPELLRLAATDYEHVPRPKLQYIVGKPLRGTPIAKEFPLGKSYGELQVSAARELQDPIMLTDNLITALTSRDAERRTAAAQYFDAEMLAGIRQGVEPKVVYELVRGELPQLRGGSRLAAERILEALTERFPRCEPLADTTIAIDSLFDEAMPFSALTLRMQRAIFNDLFDDRRLLCCAFLPNGGSHWGAYNYVLDEHIGLLHLVPKNGSNGSAAHEPIGVAICVNAIDPESGTPYLLVDSVEAGANIDTVREKQWIPFVHEGISALGRDTGAAAVVYNRNTRGVKPLKVLRYLERTYEPERKEITLIKPTSATVQRFAARTEQVYQDRLQRYAREVTEGRGEGRKAVALKEELGEFHVRMMNCYATFIEAFGRGIGRAGFVNDPIDRPYLKGEFRLPDTTIGGTVDGLVFPL